jgi:hypothetical protein
VIPGVIENSSDWLFKGWSPAIPEGSVERTKDMTFTAQYIDDSTDEATIVFLPGEHGTLSGKTEYTVTKGSAWSITAPGVTEDAGWLFDGWAPALPGAGASIDASAVYTAQYIKDPSAWATITFTTGASGTLSGKTVFEVLKGSAWSEVITLPGVNPVYGYRQKAGTAGWSPALPAAGDTIGANAAYMAQYEEDPDAWVTVTFEAGTNGTLSGTTTFKVLKGTKWQDGITVPGVTPNVDWKFIGWAPAIPAGDTAIGQDLVFIAQYEEDDGDDATIVFDAGAHGSLSGTATFTVAKGSAWAITAPGVTADTGWTFTGWSPALPSAGTAINVSMT